jgi:hypothetical protein
MLRGFAFDFCALSRSPAIRCADEHFHIGASLEFSHSAGGVTQCAGYPTQRHRSIFPTLDVARVVRDQAVEIFDRVARSEGPVQLTRDAQPLNRQRLVQSFLEASRGAGVAISQRGCETHELLLGQSRVLCIPRVAQGSVDAGTQFARQVVDDVAPLVLGHRCTANQPVLHGDIGAALKATTVLAMRYWLGVKHSYSRPRVSDDNAFSESLFRTAKYRPEFPAKGFVDLAAARAWATHFVRWYNVDHRHSGIRYVSPAQRHAGDDHAILAARHAVYTQARERNPARWSRDTRDWTPVGAVTLNPERDSVVAAATHNEEIQPLAA